MKSIHLFFIAAATFFMATARAQQAFTADGNTSACSYYGETITGDIMMHNSEVTADNVVKNIMSVIGLRPNFELRAANVPNAAAVLINSKRYILYNPKFMNDINSASGSNWAAISILAHEIGHHLNGHTLDNVGSRPETELEADEFSGFVLHRMGASLTDAQAAMALIASMKGSHSHPPKKDRLIAIATGWNNAGNTDSRDIASTSDANIEKPAVVRQPQIMGKPQPAMSKPANKPAVTSRPAAAKKEAVFPEKFVASYAYFEADPDGKYYITTKGNLVQVEDNTVYMIGRLAQSNKPGFSLMLSDKQYNYLYIATGGVIVNGAGKRVGYLRMR
jgi:hypothetical protein